MVTIIIPSYNEIYLEKTIKDILSKAKGEIEVIVHVDSIKDPLDVLDKRVEIFYENEPKGMREGINYGLERANGDYIMKIDAHCVFDDGFDIKLQKTMQDDWLVIPRRYALHATNWDRVKRLPIKDYHYLSWPGLPSQLGHAMFIGNWTERTNERMNKLEYMIDDTMTFQGSCWFAKRDYFMKRVGYLQEEGYSSFSGEQIEVGLKYWLGGGQVKVNKNTWYAHLYKNKRHYGGIETEDRDYKRDLLNKAGYEWYTEHWIHDKEPNMKHKFEWLIEKFWPVPDWPTNWKEEYESISSNPVI